MFFKRIGSFNKRKDSGSKPNIDMLEAEKEKLYMPEAEKEKLDMLEAEKQQLINDIEAIRKKITPEMSPEIAQKIFETNAKKHSTLNRKLFRVMDEINTLKPYNGQSIPL